MAGELHDLILTQAEARAIDEAILEQLGVPGLLLMENAAHAVTEQLARRADGKVVVICGPGNNGGDGLAVARQRSASGQATRVLLETAGKRLSADAQSNFDFLVRSGVDVEVADGETDPQSVLQSMTSGDWIVDSLLGTGIRGNLKSPFDQWVNAVNSSPARVLAVDVPSGLNCDDGTHGNRCVKADVTVTFVGMKRGFLAPEAPPWTGQVVVAPIGVSRDWVMQWLDKCRTT